MKCRIFSPGLVLVVLLTGKAWSQGIGLPIADISGPQVDHWLWATAGTSVSDEFTFYGVRGTFGVTEGFRLFGDIGMVDITDEDNDIGVQGGMFYRFPLELLADFGIRATLYATDTDMEDITGGTLALTASQEVLTQGMFIYGGAGVDVQNRRHPHPTEATAVPDPDDPNSVRLVIEDNEDQSSTEANPFLSIGGYVSFTDWLSAYVEVSQSDDTFLSCGIVF